MRTIIHIGQHKTGTTSIQHYLKHNRVELAREGLYVPDSFAGADNPSHFMLSVYALDPQRSSIAKDKLLAKRPAAFFTGLRQSLEADIARHYQAANSQGCKDIIWSNEGLYLLNSPGEYRRLLELFDKYSSEVVCVCCLREVESYRASYMAQLQKLGIGFSDDRDSYRYVNADSWLFDYRQKQQILGQVFEKIILFPYSKEDMVKTFMQQAGYSVNEADSLRLNVTKYT